MTKNSVFFLRVFPLTVIKIDTEGQSIGNIVVNSSKGLNISEGLESLRI